MGRVFDVVFHPVFFLGLKWGFLDGFLGFGFGSNLILIGSLREALLEPCAEGTPWSLAYPEACGTVSEASGSTIRW